MPTAKIFAAPPPFCYCEMSLLFENVKKLQNWGIYRVNGSREWNL